MEASVARRMWLVGEPLHAVTYFAAESFAAWEAAGIRGFWRGYFATRAAPFGPVGPEVVTASFFNFAPSMVERALPSVWTLATPEAALAARSEGAAAALRAIVGDAIDAAAVARATDAVREALAGCTLEGRALFAANAALAWPDEPLAALWHGLTLLREHRGDGHNAGLVAAGLDGLEAHLLAGALEAGGATRSTRLDARGWTDGEAEAAFASTVGAGAGGCGWCRDRRRPRPVRPRRRAHRRSGDGAVAPSWPGGDQRARGDAAAVGRARRTVGRRAVPQPDRVAGAELMIRGAGRLPQVRDGALASQVAWVAHRRRKVAAHVALSNQIQGHLDLVFPGLGACFDGILTTKSGRVVVRDLADPDRMRRLGLEGLVGFVARRGVQLRRPKAQQLLDAAGVALRLPPAERTPIGSPTPAPPTGPQDSSRPSTPRPAAAAAANTSAEKDPSSSAPRSSSSAAASPATTPTSLPTGGACAATANGPWSLLSRSATGPTASPSRCSAAKSPTTRPDGPPQWQAGPSWRRPEAGPPERRDPPAGINDDRRGRTEQPPRRPASSMAGAGTDVA